MDLNQFKVIKLSEHIYRIVDALNVACYLVVGEEKACLLDTCTGVENIKSWPAVFMFQGRQFQIGKMIKVIRM